MSMSLFAVCVCCVCVHANVAESPTVSDRVHESVCVHF